MFVFSLLKMNGAALLCGSAAPPFCNKKSAARKSGRRFHINRIFFAEKPSLRMNSHFTALQSGTTFSIIPQRKQLQNNAQQTQNVQCKEVEHG